MVATKPGNGINSTPRFAHVLFASLLSALMVAAGAIGFLAMDLPAQTGDPLEYPVSDMKFAFGSGKISKNQLLVDEFPNGYALLTTGAISIQADTLRVLRYQWIPPNHLQEAAFFWRRADNTQDINRLEIISTGKNLVDLSFEPGWKGEITEFGFLLAGDSGEVVSIGATTLLPDGLKTRLLLTWNGWSMFEGWSQQSINFLYGGDYRQLIALPLLVTAWLVTALVLYGLMIRRDMQLGSRRLLTNAGMMFLVAWFVLDTRWSVNNIRQIQRSLQTSWHTDEQQRAGKELDGDIYQIAHRLKNEVLGAQPARIILLGDESISDYKLLRAKYHLLPHSVNVVGAFTTKQLPGSLDYVIYLGQAGITGVAGWNSNWASSLVQVDGGNWGAVYRVN